MSEQVITVGGLTAYIKNLLESDEKLFSFTVTGEISNLTNHRSGHLYFALKDENAVINAVMFRSCAERLTFKPENGMKVRARGKISVFEPAGRYQVMVTSMETDGIGDLYIAYEKLKKKLEAEGLFDRSLKRAIPKFPRCVGVVTSPTGAAVRDIINVLGRRFPYCSVLLYPSLVQGEGAAAGLLTALRFFETKKCADVVIIGRGGGSIEDLWAFNDEALARFIHSMTVPVISAVGHETDFTICDFVSDLRAPTPSAAAELAVPDTSDMLFKFSNVDKRLKMLLSQKLEITKRLYDSLAGSRVLTSPEFITEHRQLLLEHNTEKLYSTLESAITKAETGFEKAASKLDALSPLKIMSRGYLFARTGDDGRIVKSVDDIEAGDTLSLRLCDGNAQCNVDTVTKETNGDSNGK